MIYSTHLLKPARNVEFGSNSLKEVIYVSLKIIHNPFVYTFLDVHVSFIALFEIIKLPSKIAIKPALFM